MIGSAQVKFRRSTQNKQTSDLDRDSVHIRLSTVKECNNTDVDTAFTLIHCVLTML